MGYLPLIIGYLIIWLTPAIGLWHNRMEDLGRKKTDAFIPFYNYFVILKACKLPWYWIFFFLFPGAQFVMWSSINVTYIRKFGEFGVKETILGVIFPFPVFWKIAKNKEEYKVAEPTNWDVAKQVDARTPSDHVALFFALPVIGHAIAIPWSMLGFKRKPGKKSIFKDWGDAIIFAVVAASVIRTYVFEPFKIPTGSMEKTLLVGDQLFVDKITYGPRVPMTPFSYPIVHNSFAPLVNIKSYLNIQPIPYTRLPGLRDVERNDVVVFNFPAGDSALNDPRMPYGLIGHTYGQILMDEAFYLAGYDAQQFEENKEYYVNKARKQFNKEGKTYNTVVSVDREKGYTEFSGILERPVDKKENYIKRCVAVAGDEIEIIDKELYVNGELAWQPPNMQYHYSRVGSMNPSYVGNGMWDETMYNFYLANFDARGENCSVDDSMNITIPMNKAKYNEIKDQFPDVKPYIKKKGFYNDKINSKQSRSYYNIFPNDPQYDWTEDNFGPLRIPKKGDVVELNKKTIPIYRRIIHAYEGHELQEKADGIYVDGKKVDTYTIEMNYYWMMGDNRNGSADSRFWGFVPEDHVVGHAAFTWLSVDQQKGMFGGGMRWSRMFNGIE